MTAPDDPPPKLKVPLDWVAVDAVGAALTGLGLAGFLGGGAELLPILSQPAVAGGCVLVGMFLMGYAMVQILTRMRASLRRGED